MVALPNAHSHRFTPDDEPRSWNDIEPLLEELAAMPVEEADELLAFLDAWDEFDCWVGDHISRARVATRQHTDDTEARDHFLYLNAEVIPRLSARGDRLGRKLIDSPAVDTLDGTPYEVFVDQVRNDVELFREENIPLQKEVNELTNRYQEISGGWEVEFDGGSHTMAQMRRFYSNPDRDVRRGAWEAATRTRRGTSDELETLYEELFGRRHQIAKNAGFDNYRDYAFAAKMRDYEPDACFALHELVEAEVVPLVEEISEDLTDRLGLDSLRPWDGHADPEGRQPLSPYEDTEQLKDGVERMMRRLDPNLGAQFEAMRSNMDLESRPHKAQGGFMTRFPWTARPFIFANASGVHSDIVTLLHECGHAFHYLASRDATPMESTAIPMEFNEVTSMAMELLHYRTLDEFYGEEDRERAISEHLRRLPRVLASVARGDAFQHWLYTHPDHTREQRRARWLEVDERFSGHVDWSGIDEDDRIDGYHMILHFFIVPFYFIEYGFAQLGALQVAVNAEEDLEGAMRAYREALALGPQRDTAGLYEAAGAQFVPTRDRVRELMDWIRERLFV